jgi:hypothetical protein
MGLHGFLLQGIGIGDAAFFGNASVKPGKDGQVVCIDRIAVTSTDVPTTWIEVGVRYGGYEIPIRKFLPGTIVNWTYEIPNRFFIDGRYEVYARQFGMAPGNQFILSVFGYVSDTGYTG